METQPNKPNKPTPVLKWVGGKKRLLSTLSKYFPKKYNDYYEPFLGGGSVFFNFQPKQAYISDLNKTLINLYISIRDNYDKLKTYLLELQDKNTEKEYYEIRKEFNELRKKDLEPDNVYISALLVYLNKAGYGGVYRENSKGGYNVPYGKYKTLNLYDENKFQAVKEVLSNKKINIQCSGYEYLNKMKKGDFAYLDPPYDPEEKTSFTKYHKGDFNRKDQENLANMLKKLDKKGVKFLLSNSNTEFIRELYKDFTIVEVTVGRYINNKKNLPKKEPKQDNEILVFNYDNNKSSKKKQIKIST